MSPGAVLAAVVEHLYDLPILPHPRDRRMVRRVSLNQYQSMLRQAAREQQRALDEYNRRVRKFNAQQDQRRREFNRAIDAYNRKARADNALVDRNRRELRDAIVRLGQSRIAVRSAVYYRSTLLVHQRYETVEQQAPGTWLEERDDILDLAHGEAANAVALAHAGVGDSISAPADDLDVTGRLTEFDPELAARWRGASFALSPNNPDAARHFSTSAREILNTIIETEARDDEVLAALPGAQLTKDGRPTRRTRLAYCLIRAGRQSDHLAAFADVDVQNVLDLFGEFNDGTHGSAGVFDLGHLALMRRRVAGAIEFLHAILRT